MSAMGKSGIGHLMVLRREYPMNLPSLGQQHNPSMQMDKVELRENKLTAGDDQYGVIMLPGSATSSRSSSPASSRHKTRAAVRNLATSRSNKNSGVQPELGSPVRQHYQQHA